MPQALSDGKRRDKGDTNRSHSVDGTGEAVIGDGRVPGFDGPQRLAATQTPSRDSVLGHLRDKAALHCLTLHFCCQRRQS